MSYKNIVLPLFLSLLLFSACKDDEGSPAIDDNGSDGDTLTIELLRTYVDAEGDSMLFRYGDNSTKPFKMRVNGEDGRFDFDLEYNGSNLIQIRGTGFVETYDYNIFGQLIGLNRFERNTTTNNDLTLVESLTFSYNVNGQLAEVNQLNAGKIEYEYTIDPNSDPKSELLLDKEGMEVEFLVFDYDTGKNPFFNLGLWPFFRTLEGRPFVYRNNVLKAFSSDRTDGTVNFRLDFDHHYDEKGRLVKTDVRYDDGRTFAETYSYE